MKHITIGDNELFFHLLRDLPYFQPVSNFYGITVRSLDTDTSKTLLVRDQSSSPASYQLFPLTATTGTEYLSSGVVSMLPYGMWYAEVHAATGDTLADVTTEVLWRGMISSNES